MKKIPKSSVDPLNEIHKSGLEIFLAADDQALVFDDNDDTYLVISMRDQLTKILKS